MRRNTTFVDALQIILGGSAIAIAIVLLARRSSARMQQESVPLIPIPLIPMAERPASHAVPPPASADLIGLLRTSEMARKVFAYQSFLFSYGYTPKIPDGRLGNITRGWIRDINRLWGDRNPSNVFTNLSLLRAVQTLRDKLGRVDQRRLLPFSLPPDVIAAVNNTMLAQNPNFVIGLLRVDPTA